jgi:hypothetical protein
MYGENYSPLLLKSFKTSVDCRLDEVRYKLTSEFYHQKRIKLSVLHEYEYSLVSVREKQNNLCTMLNMFSLKCEK